MLTGQADSDVGFFPNADVLQNFRDFVYESQNIHSQHPMKRSSCGRVLLKVTIVLRMQNRRILNLPALCRMLESEFGSEWLDLMWLNTHIVTMEQLSFEQQVQLMADTDILISVHGSVFANCIFQRPHSAAIAIMQSRHMEYVLPQVIYINLSPT